MTAESYEHARQITQAIWDVTRKDGRSPVRVFRDFYGECVKWDVNPRDMAAYAICFDPETNGLPKYLLDTNGKGNLDKVYRRAERLVL